MTKTTDPYMFFRKQKNTWIAKWTEDGNERTKSLGTPNQRIAKQKLTILKLEIRSGKVKPKSSEQIINPIFSAFVQEFLESIELRVETSTHYLYKVALDKAIACFGKIHMADITSRHTEIYQNHLLKSGLAVPTVNKNYRHFKAAIKKAIEWEYIPHNIIFAKAIKEEKKIRYIKPHDFKKLMETIHDEEFKDFCMFSAFTGLRSGELIRLVKSDVDNPIGFLRISSKQKNKDESRVPINKSVRLILERWVGKKKKIFRFTTESWVSQKFKGFVKKAKIETDHHFHDFRHSFASYLAMQGVDMKVIQELMRHQSIVSTLVYAKLSPQRLQQVSEMATYDFLDD